MVSEKMMEDSISSEPEKYLGEKGLRLVARQYSIGSYVFDMLFEDRHGAKLIVELQKGTLDRTHTYKILDYYDEYKDKNPNAFIELMVIANRIPHERRRRLDVHGVSWKEIPESEFDNQIGAYSEPRSAEGIRKNKIEGGHMMACTSRKNKLIADIYDKIGSILKDIHLNNASKTFTTDELYAQYVRRYPEDKKFLEQRGGPMTLKMYVPGMVWEYSRKTWDNDPDKPLIQYLSSHTYRFIS